MRAMVWLLGAWLVGLYAVGLAVGYGTRWAACVALYRQERAYRRLNGGHPPPRSARRGICILTAALAVALTFVLGLALHAVGLRPPGTQGFTFWAFVILVMPGCVAGAAWGSSLAFSKGRLSHWPVPVETPAAESTDGRRPPRTPRFERPGRRRSTAPHHYPGFEPG